ncbi:hypothetical protein METBIDRAFT_35275 [Metschnikowia bicuspidata var. bicuspidata NRRL YB-4993]|uniref:Interferon-related developmental regulator N-terminal domain-containing protein n=1 Tax=Metschnikowia bicuspidata var. bicuspidata NRRL YB-4993 TaxID=869754 RepID=A0A1A0HJY9_9ASCO|nr:hypothetical protein METBIDRAFT_35275 [Metschnikowia bicuspidata var. bicuspidata NRRL YB-4993]OBA24494.1 hypothetical protein METBIDRAFT_35275 [Metschnikowia bicuspidata var. bicuspidata NRRL YB-4993]
MSKQFYAKSLIKEPLSNSSSRSVSRVRTPLPDGEENGALDVNFLTLEELISRKLESLQSMLLLSEAEETENRDSMVADSQDYRQKNAVSMNKARIQSGSTTINDIALSLQHSRSSVSSLSRELLLAQLYKIIVTKPIPVFNEEVADNHSYVTEEVVLSFVKLLTTGDYRSATEFILLYRSVIALLASDLEDFGELVSLDFIETLENLILAPANLLINNENKASVITGYCGLLLILYGGTSSFGVDDKVKWLLELAQGFVQSSLNLKLQLNTGDREYSTLMHESEDKRLIDEQESRYLAEANVAVSALHGVGVLVTLLQKGEYLNDLLSTLATDLVTIVDNDENVEISKAAAKVLALCYESYTYESASEDDDDDDTEFNYNSPYYEQEAIINTCMRLSNLSSRRVGKKEKKDTNSVFQEVAKTIEYYTNAEQREEIYKLSPTGLELLAASVSSTHVKLSRSKSLSINSWFLYFRLLHLKWCFGFGLHDQLVENPEIKALLKMPGSKYQQKYGAGDEETLGDLGFSRNAKTDVERFAKTDKKRANDLKKAREDKISQNLEELQIEK